MDRGVKRILVVEDAADIRTLLTELLEEASYEVSAASDGHEALLELRSTAQLPRLILLDLMMPRMDGYRFRAEQCSDPRLRDIPVLLMTAGGDIQAKAAEIGASGYLKKPFKDIDAILAQVAEFFV